MKTYILAVFIGFIGVSGSIAAPSASQTELDSVQSAVVDLDGRPLFRVRGMAGYTAEDRAKAIKSRLVAAAENHALQPTDIALVDETDRTKIMLDDVVLVTVLEADAATEKIPRAIMAEQARNNIIRAMEDFRHDRSAKILLRRAGIAVAATLGFIFLLFSLGRLYKTALAYAERSLKSQMEDLEKRSSNVIESRPLWTAIVGIMGAVRFLAVAALSYFYLNMVLGLFPWTRPLAVQLFSIFVAPLKKLGTNILSAAPDLAFLVILTLIIRYVLKVTYLFFKGIAVGNFTFKDFDPDWALPTYKIARFLIICFAAVVAYPYIPGSNSDAFKGVSLFVGVLFSLGSTSLIANLVASLALLYRRAFKVGDVIKVNDVMGLVTEMRMQATHLRTRYNEMIVMPNSVIVNSHVINYSHLCKTEGLMLNTTVGIGYSTPWRQVEAMLLMAAERTPGLKKDKKPFIRQKALDTFTIQYELLVFCDMPIQMFNLYSELHRNIVDVFNEFGVQIMTPAYEGDPESPKIVSKEQWHTAPAAPANGEKARGQST